MFAEAFGFLVILAVFRANRGIAVFGFIDLVFTLIEVFLALLSSGCTDLLPATLAVFVPPLAEVTTFFLRSIFSF